MYFPKGHRLHAKRPRVPEPCPRASTFDIIWQWSRVNQQSYSYTRVLKLFPYRSLITMIIIIRNFTRPEHLLFNRCEVPIFFRIKRHYSHCGGIFINW
jgi:hypothetical protein